MYRKSFKKSKRSNPYFRPSARRRLPAKLIANIAFFLIVFTFFAALMFGSWMKIDSIKVTGVSENMSKQAQDYTTELLSKNKFLIFSRSHRWLYDPEKLTDELTEKYNLNSVNITKTKKHLDIEITERISTFYIKQNDEIFALDAQGNVINKIDDIDRVRIEMDHSNGKGFPLIIDERNKELTGNQNIINQDEIEKIITLFELIKSDTMTTPLTAKMTDEEGRIDVETEMGVSLYFTLNREVDSQVSKLASLVDKKKVDIATLEYIDLRFESRIYYH